ncbi:VWA domain-containing protein [Cryptosporangium phraense]|uniref:VWA domain-containing protein n=1 Tax=Cryptosporangium phraense TaxID=2593070 RepID=A0A545ATU7_9ACTN|nr:VWA domain-containing protein [Cryptosporangium phraense]TQS44767.1 VWA domain-containing protein [Cryptosporangium phraense]
MSLHWPWALLALLAVPLLLVARWWFNRRRRRTALQVSSVALIRAALPGRSAWRRRIPVLLFLIGLLPLAAGLTRPEASVQVPTNDSSILLAIDVSGSMCSTDIDPNRLAVASEAARKFIRSQDNGTKIGLVAFSGIAGLLVAPTTDQDALLGAIDGLKTARGTAIGQAILTAIDAIAEINPDVMASGIDLSGAAPTPQDGQAPPGDYEPDTIVVLTDGSNTQGVDPVTAAEQAAARRVRVYTIGFGTTEPAPMVCTADQISGDATGGNWGGTWGGGPRGGGRRVQQIDEAALKSVADLTGGRYFKAEDADQLADVLGDLPSQIGLQKKKVEITVWFVLVGAVLVFSGVALSLWWNRPRERV